MRAFWHRKFLYKLHAYINFVMRNDALKYRGRLPIIRLKIIAPA